MTMKIMDFKAMAMTIGEKTTIALKQKPRKTGETLYMTRRHRLTCSCVRLKMQQAQALLVRKKLYFLVKTMSWRI